MSKPIDQEREAFEKEFKVPNGTHFSDGRYQYADHEIIDCIKHAEQWKGWQARASVQPAGGAVPVMQFQMKHPSSGEAYMVEFTREEVADGLEDQLYEKLGRLVCDCGGEADHECGDYIHDFELQAAAPHPVSEVARHALSAENQRVKPVEPMLAPRHPFDKPFLLKDCNVSYSNSSVHPVSGEQKPDALRKRFSDIEDEIMAGKHNAASVFTAMRTAALYIGKPASHDVAVLVEALEEIADPIKFMRARLEDGEQLNGVYAIQMADSGNYLREIAKRALAAHRAQQGEQPS